jgi:hypothetical protein
MNLTFKLLIITLIGLVLSCTTSKKEEKKEYAPGTFGYDLQSIGKKDSLVILKNAEGNAQVMVSPKYQAKVFTSTAEGLDGNSFGWVNHDAINSDKFTPHMQAYGSEDRLWLGPEGGQFSIYFAPESKMEFANWTVPAPIDSEPWKLVSSDRTNAEMEKEMKIVNYSGSKFEIHVNRNIRLIEKEGIKEILDIVPDNDIKWVGYESENIVTNTGENEWTEESGTVSIWILGMFNCSPNSTVVAPYKEGSEDELGKIATTNYFGELPPDRIKYENGLLYFKVDGQKRSKIGLSPQRALPITGSYDPDNNLLTVVKFSVHANNNKYVNSLWEEKQEEPFKGDVLNSYNDGPLEDGSQLGPFFEIESSSPAAFLKPGEKISHYQNVFHFVGEKEQLTKITEALFGVSTEEIAGVFR